MPANSYFTNAKVDGEILAATDIEAIEQGFYDVEQDLALKLAIADIDDTAVNGETSAPISSNWAYDHENATAAHGVTGDVVGTTDAQTLSSKTLTSPDINGGTIDGAVIGGTTKAEGSFTGVTVVEDSPSGGTAVTAADDLVIDNDTNAGLTILTGNNYAGRMEFGDQFNGAVGGLIYNHPTDTLTIRAEDATVVSLGKDTGLVVNRGGIKLDNLTTSDDNTLDDYEVGSWNPRLEDSDSHTATLSSFGGRYVKVGKLVHVSGRIAASSVAALTADNLQIGNLPFANSSTHSAGSVGNASNLNITAGQGVTIQVNSGVSHLNLKVWDISGGSTNMTAAEFSNNGDLSFQATYQTS